MQRERQKGNRDFGNRHIALFLSLVLLILCLVPGCDTLAVGIGGDAGSDTAAVFDSFTRDLFIDLASQDELTLNYTLADPSAYGITEAKSVFGSYSLENQKAEEELDEQLLEALKGIRENLIFDYKRKMRFSRFTFCDIISSLFLREGRTFMLNPITKAA